MRTKRQDIPGGFTLVEVLTTVAIIGILLAVLIPALNQVGKTAVIVKQRAQFHAIEIALESFRSDTGQYPPSEWNTTIYGNYSASQRLAEAIVGRDGFGFHQDSRYHWNGQDSASQNLYAPLVDPQTTLTERKGPYLELESANAVNLAAYADDYGNLINSTLPSYVLADSFKSTRLDTGRKTGMPILYYRANPLKTRHDVTAQTFNTYELRDSIGVPAGGYDGLANRPSGKHQMAFLQDWFYNRTRNPNFTERPYRAESFILHSAGPDGIYGTADDIFNFEEEN